jgi:hypothetical protein
MVVMSVVDYQEHRWTVKRSDVGDIDDKLSKASIYCQEIPKAGDR